MLMGVTRGVDETTDGGSIVGETASGRQTSQLEPSTEIKKWESQRDVFNAQYLKFAEGSIDVENAEGK